MASFKVGGEDYMYSGFTGALLSGTLYRLKPSEMGNIQVPVRKGSAEFKRVESALSSRNHQQA
ncbi:hypothetical protein [Pseudomonas sp. UMAB-40]|uniref:hypothetical protein n=1 Tax=Pseudomonas sp. UMAB-40 TaxID=1365407 RepID=UPI001C5667C8|nr:hypothetical protein [Pseudomonas sp. UMAB-40]